MSDIASEGNCSSGVEDLDLQCMRLPVHRAGAPLEIELEAKKRICNQIADVWCCASYD